MAATAQPGRPASSPWRLVFRGLLLVATCVSLYLLFPSLVEVFSSWPALVHMHPLWFLLGVLFEATSFVSLWEVQRIALRTPSWFTVGTAELASNAAGSVIPGGAAAAGALGYRMLVRAGVHAGDVASGLAAVVIGTSVTAFALPVLSLPAIIGGASAPRGLRDTAYVGAATFLLTVAAGVAAFVWDEPLRVAARGAGWVLRHLPGDRDVSGLPERVLRQRDRLRGAFGARWPLALLGFVGKPGFDYLALLCCLAAVGAGRPNPSLVLLAYAAGALLAMIPVTPGGLGFVEAGLTGMLVLAGVDAHAAVVATLAYRLLGFWLPLPTGGVAYLLYRHRYGAAGETSTSTTSP